MTAAVCLECGKMKTAAWTACPACGHVPESDEDRARHVITTDHFQSAASLQAISARIAAGQPVVFEPNQLRAVMENLQRLDSKRKRRARTSFIVIVLSILATVVYFILHR